MNRELQSSIVTKCATVLDILARTQKSLNFTEVVAISGFTKSSTHRIISVLLGEGLVEYEERTKCYTLGPRLVGWARAAWQQTDLQQITDAELLTLKEQTGLNVVVSIRSGDSVLFIRTMDSQSLRYAAKVGEESPLHCTAAGKLFLAYGGQGAGPGIPPGYDLEKYTEYTITNAKRLEIELEKVRKDGFAVCDREEFLQVSGIAAPVFDYQSRMVAAIGLWAPTKLASADDLVKNAHQITKVAAAISGRFGAMAND